MADKVVAIDAKCGCGAHLFVELYSEPSYVSTERLLGLATAWVNAHAAHHAEPKAKK